MKVDLFYAELKYVKIEQQQAYDLAAFFSEYGLPFLMLNTYNRVHSHMRLINVTQEGYPILGVVTVRVITLLWAGILATGSYSSHTNKHTHPIL